MRTHVCVCASGSPQPQHSTAQHGTARHYLCVAPYCQPQLLYTGIVSCVHEADINPLLVLVLVLMLLLLLVLVLVLMLLQLLGACGV